MLRRTARCNTAALSLMLVAAALSLVRGQEALISPAMGGTATSTAILGNGVGPPGGHLFSASIHVNHPGWCWCEEPWSVWALLKAAGHFL